MRNLAFILMVIGVLLFVGCRRQHVFHTYYGDIDVDTIEIKIIDEEDFVYYLVHHEQRKDSSIYGKDTVRWFSTIKHYYCPDQGTYYETFPDNHGRETIVDFNPYTNSYE